MQDKVGETFEGTISGVTSFGLFVTLDELHIDGLVHVTELGRDYFHFDAGRHAMIGERSGRVFQLAGRVRVKVARVDLETTKIDFTLAEPAAEAPADAPGLPGTAAGWQRSASEPQEALTGAAPVAGRRTKECRNVLLNNALGSDRPLLCAVQQFALRAARIVFPTTASTTAFGRQ